MLHVGGEMSEVLPTIVTTHREEVVFKGGTSLEKMRIIQRFSEDNYRWFRCPARSANASSAASTSVTLGR
jgi:hypothetical protein